MKAALVLNADSPCFLQHAGEMGRLLDGLDPAPETELWLFHHCRAPRTIPDLSGRVDRVWLIPVKTTLAAEAYLSLLERMFHSGPVDALMLSGDDLGGELAVRLAHRLGGASCLDVEAIGADNAGLTIRRPAYGHNMTALFRPTRKPCCLCPARSGGPPAETVEAGALSPRTVDLEPEATPWVKEARLTPVQVRADLEEAGFVLAVGQGVGSRENLEKLGRMAEALGAEIGVSRPVAMNGWADMDRLIGASGKVLSPSLCLAAGVSGSSVFTYGIRNSDFIVAVNTDADAPIFDTADVGLVGEMMDVVAELAELAVSSINKGEE